MRSNGQTRRRWVAAVGLTAAVGAGLVLAEQPSTPRLDVKTQSVAFTAPVLSRLPVTAPQFTTPQFTAPTPPAAPPVVAPTEPTLGAQGHDGSNTAICQSLLNARQSILASPPGPARDAALALNSFWLAYYHCAPISGE